MKPTETVQLVALVEQLWPGTPLADYTPDAWHEVLADLPYQLAVQAVRRLAMLARRRPAAGDVRRTAAEVAGLLAPDEDQAWQLVLGVATAEGVGRSRLPAPVRDAYDAMGGSLGIRNGSPGTTRAQFRDLYRMAKARADDQLLLSNLADPISRALDAATHRALNAPTNPGGNDG